MGHKDVVQAAAPVLEVHNVAKRYTAELRPSMRHGLADLRGEFAYRNPHEAKPLREAEFYAVKGVSFTVRPGGSFGILGRNGAGKSTLLRILAGISKPDDGEVAIRGRVGSVLDTSGGFNPILTGRENVRASCHLWGVGHDEFTVVEDRIMAFADLGPFADAPFRTYSRGMRMRLGFATAIGLTPDLLLVDEVLAVGDIAFQRKCANHIRSYLDDGGALVLVTHSVLAVQAICSEALVLEVGSMIDCGDASSVVLTYTRLIADHESTAALEAAAALREAEPEPSQEDSELKQVEEIDGRSTAPPADDPVVASPQGSVAVDGGFDPFLDRPAAFGTITVSDAQGGPPRSGESPVVETSVTSKLEATGLMWALLVYSADGTLCITADQTVPDVMPVSVEVGLTMLRAELSDVQFVPGMYTLRMALLEAETGSPFALHGMDTPAVSFEIVGPNPQRGAMQKYLGSPLVGLEVSDWRVE